MVLEQNVKKVQVIQNKLIILMENQETKIAILNEPLATIETILSLPANIKSWNIFKIDLGSSQGVLLHGEQSFLLFENS